MNIIRLLRNEKRQSFRITKVKNLKWPQKVFVLAQTFRIDGNPSVETFAGAPLGTLTQLQRPASSSESLSISPSTCTQYQKKKKKIMSERECQRIKSVEWQPKEVSKEYNDDFSHIIYIIKSV